MSNSTRRPLGQHQPRNQENQPYAVEPAEKAVSMLQLTQQTHETLIQQYQGNDPLSVHTVYISTMQELVEQGQAPFEVLYTLLESTTNRFAHDKRYRNSRSYLKLWIILADCSDNPIAIFNRIRKFGIGQKMAMFYQAHALVLENHNQIEAADGVYMNGLKNGASPIAALVDSYDSFKRRNFQQVNESVSNASVAVSKPVQAKPTAPVKVQPANVVKGYIPNAILNEQGEEICFEEYRAMQRAQAMKAAMAPRTEEVKAVIKKKKPRESICGINMLQGFLSVDEYEGDSVQPNAPPILMETTSPADRPPSPTIHTKVAMSDIDAMFGDSPIVQRTGDFQTRSLTDELPRAYTEEVTESPAPLAFSIFEDPVVDDKNEDEEEEEEEEEEASINVFESVKPAAPITIFSDFDDVPAVAPIVSEPKAPVSSVVSTVTKTLLLEQHSTTSPVTTDMDFDAQDIITGDERDIEIGDKLFHITSVDASSSVSTSVCFLSQDLDSDGEEHVWMKIKADPKDVDGLWEFYVNDQLRKRVPLSEQRRFELIETGHVSDQYLVLCSVRSAEDFTLNSVVRANITRGNAMHPNLVGFYAVELLHTLEALQKAQLVHGNISTHCLSLRKSNDKHSIALRNFGDTSLDMSVLMTDFTACVGTANEFIQQGNATTKMADKCATLLGQSIWHPELLDRVGFCSTVCELMFQKPLELVHAQDGKQLAVDVKEKFPHPIWHEMFRAFLNTNDKVDYTAWRSKLENHQIKVGADKSLKLLFCEQNIAVCSH